MYNSAYAYLHTSFPAIGAFTERDERSCVGNEMMVRMGGAHAPAPDRFLRNHSLESSWRMTPVLSGMRWCGSLHCRCDSEEKWVPGICLPWEKAQCPLCEVILDPEAFLFGELPEVFGHDARVDLGKGVDRDECFHGGGGFLCGYNPVIRDIGVF